MTGHVFHPGHQELHGITVVVRTGSQVLIGRFDRQDERGVHLIGVSVHEAENGETTEEAFLARTAKFGVRVDLPYLTIPGDQVHRMEPLGQPDA
jgi:hypothetical protein